MPDGLAASGAAAAAAGPQDAMKAGRVSFGVMIASYRRPASLDRCLNSLTRQVRRPDDVIVVYRDTDTATRDMLETCSWTGLTVRAVAVTEPGTVCARNAGLKACRTDLLAIIDDDTCPVADWAARIIDTFAGNPRLGGLGGRDHVHDGQSFDERCAEPVGVLEWTGRVVGNHHLGHGTAREVHTLKGANMAFRAAAFADTAFDVRLRGTGAQSYEDLAFSMAVRRKGWILVYDPAIAVDHFAGRPEKRSYSSISRVEDAKAFRCSAFNMVLAIWPDLSPLRRAVFVAWSILVGTGVHPGLVQAVRYSPALGGQSWFRFWLTQRGKLDAYCMMMYGLVRQTRGRVDVGRFHDPSVLRTD